MPHRRCFLAPLLLLGCGEIAPLVPPPPEAPPSTTSSRVFLTPHEQTVRASMAIRGVRPTRTELALIEESPNALGALVDFWLDSPEFLETVMDMHAEQLQVRTDGNPDMELPSKGPLAGRAEVGIAAAIQEEPLRLVAHVVGGDRPYTEIITADYTVADPTVAAVYGLEHDPSGPEWQVTRWVDGRVHAGILASSQLWRRHLSAGNSFHRGRANLVADLLVCEDIAGREVSIQSTANIADPLAVAETVATDPACVSCHQTLDPLAAVWWGWVGHLNHNQVEGAYAADCRTAETTNEKKSDLLPYELTCYPSHLYQPSEEDGWIALGLRPPGWFGQPVTDLADLGQTIAADTRFATCTARRFASWLGQIEREQVPAELVAEWGSRFSAGGFDTKALVRDIVLSDAFLSRPQDDAPGGIPVLMVRPEAHARSIAALTGFEWWVDPGRGCAGCGGEVDLLRSDLYGFRAMAGGIDGFLVTHPTFLPTATRSLTHRRVAELAASWSVEEGSPLLLGVDLGAEDEATVRAGLTALHRSVLAEEPEPVDIDETWSLFSSARAAGRSTTDCWKLALSLLLQDPRLVVY